MLRNLNLELMHFHHASVEISTMCHAFYKPKGKGKVDMNDANVLCFGLNTLGNIEGTVPGVHAEHDAILKLRPLKRKKKLMPINMLVVRLSKINKLQSSKPCHNCIHMMKTLAPMRGYSIKNVYHSNKDGEIIKTNLSELGSEEKHISKYYRQQRKKH
jgi:ribosomal protein L34E